MAQRVTPGSLMPRVVAWVAAALAAAAVALVVFLVLAGLFAGS